MEQQPSHIDLEQQAQLIEGLQAGNASAMETVFRLYYKRLYFFAFKVIERQMDAEDIVQDVLLKFWTGARDKGTVPSHIEGYLFSMVRNKCLNHLERQRMLDERNGAVIEEFYHRHERRMDELAVQEEIFRRLKDDFSRLTAVQAQVMQLLFVEGVSVADAATRLGTTVNNIRNHKARALERLKSGLQKGLLITILFFLIFFSGLL